MVPKARIRQPDNDQVAKILTGPCRHPHHMAWPGWSHGLVALEALKCGYQPRCPRLFVENRGLSYSSRRVLAGSIPAIRSVGKVVATSVTTANPTTTVMIVGRS
jgi:hypothetical protein